MFRDPFTLVKRIFFSNRIPVLTRTSFMFKYCLSDSPQSLIKTMQRKTLICYNRVSIHHLLGHLPCSRAAPEIELGRLRPHSHQIVYLFQSAATQTKRSEADDLVSEPRIQRSPRHRPGKRLITLARLYVHTCTQMLAPVLCNNIIPFREVLARDPIPRICLNLTCLDPNDRGVRYLVVCLSFCRSTLFNMILKQVADYRGSFSFMQFKV